MDFDTANMKLSCSPRTKPCAARKVALSGTASDKCLVALKHTEQVESQAVMRASEIRYRRLFEAARDGIHNIATLTRYAVSSGVVESNRMPNWSATSPLRATG
jgi:hypothetical protein